MTLTMTRKLSLWMAFAVLAGTFAAWSQVTTATILGTAKDQSDAVLPGATITATNVETGITRTAVTGSRGEYRIPALSLGAYQVSANMAGFQTEVRSGITLSLGREAVVDFTLSVGNVAEQVTVTGEAPLIETTTATVSGLVDPQQMRDIPLNARSFIELVPLQAGAVVAEQGGVTAYTGFGLKVSVGGTRYSTNAFVLDGANINDMSGTAGSAAGTLAGVESVREFKVITNAYDAEYGRHTGGVVSAVTKSGTNDFHGSLFEFLRNEKLDAPTFDNNRQRAGKKDPFRRNQFGGTLGGPVKRNSTFFFGSFEALRESLGSLANYTMPGPLIRQGCIPRTSGTGASQVRSSVDCLRADGTFESFNPANTPSWPVIPSTAGFIAPNIRPFMAAYPQGNQQPTSAARYPDGGQPNGTVVLARSESQITNQNYWTARMDQTFSDQDTFFFRYNNDIADRTDPGFDTAFLTDSKSRLATMEETHIFSPALLARTHFSFNHQFLATVDKTQFELGKADYKLPQYSFAYNDIPGIMNPGTIQTWGGGVVNPKVHVQNSFQFKEDLFHSQGRHAIKFGGLFNRIQFNQRSDNRAGGSYAFGGLDNFLQGTVSSLDLALPGSDNRRGWRQNILGLYLQDDVSLRPGLALNLGLRYEIISTPYEVNGKAATIRDLRPHHFYTLTINEVDIGDPYILNPSLKNLAPRIGIAWTPFASGKTVVRTGGGMFHEQITSVHFITAGAIQPPLYRIGQATSNEFRRVSGQVIAFPDAFITQSNLLLQGGGAPRGEGMEWAVSQPAVYKISFSVQQQLLSDTTLEVGYSGTRSTHNARGAIQMNTSPVREIATLGGDRYIFPEQPLPNPNFEQMRWRYFDGSGWYNGLLMTLSKRFRNGFQLQSSYTFSKSLDDSSTSSGSAEFGNDAQGVRNEHWKGRSAFDVTHSWSTSFVYELPGSQLSGVAGKLLGGWNLSGILRAVSGSPVTPTATRPTVNRLSSGALTANGGTTACSNAQILAGTCTQSAVRMVGGGTVNLTGSKVQINPGNREQYFDTAQFAWPSAFVTRVGDTLVANPALANFPGAGRDGAPGAVEQIGNIGRNTITVPGLFNLDLTLRKDTAIAMLGEAGKMELRFEMFNAPNHPRLGEPGTTIFDNQGRLNGTAGVIEGSRGNARQLQVAMRLVF